MEVHNHPHLPHQKKLTDYLFEYFMIFLAVVLGFCLKISGSITSSTKGQNNMHSPYTMT
jgi:hypothetical protein